MALYAVKTTVQTWMIPFARRVPVSPNAVTVLGLGVMIAGSCLLAYRRPFAAGGLFLASGLLDLLDGAVARAQERQTRYGALLDRVADRLGDLAALAGAALGGYAGAATVVLAAGTMLIASYVSACLEGMTQTRVGEVLSLRGLRIAVLVLACFSDRIFLGVVTIGLMGLWAIATRLRRARRLLA